jgi:hypothetical protein
MDLFEKMDQRNIPDETFYRMASDIALLGKQVKDTWPTYQKYKKRGIFDNQENKNNPTGTESNPEHDPEPKPQPMLPLQEQAAVPEPVQTTQTTPATPSQISPSRMIELWGKISEDVSQQGKNISDQNLLLGDILHYQKEIITELRKLNHTMNQQPSCLQASAPSEIPAHAPLYPDLLQGARRSSPMTLSSTSIKRVRASSPSQPDAVPTSNASDPPSATPNKAIPKKVSAMERKQAVDALMNHLTFSKNEYGKRN